MAAVIISHRLNMSHLVQEGLTAARVGDMAQARQLLTQATEESPQNVEAWLALAGVVEPLEEKERCFTKVLAIEPQNSQAQAGLERVKEKLASQVVTDTGVGFCYRHPEVETALRCNRCGKFICPKCAKRTPVGFRCPDCIRQQEDRFYTGETKDYLIAVMVSLPLSFIIVALFTNILGSFWLFGLLLSFILAPVVAGSIAEAVRWAVGKRRSRYLGQVVAACFGLSCLFFILPFLFIGAWYALMPPAILLFVGTTTILARLR